MSAYLAQPLAPGTPPSRRAESALSRALRFHMPQSGAGIKRPAPLLRECRPDRLLAGTSALGDLTRLLDHHLGLLDAGDVDEQAVPRHGPLALLLGMAHGLQHTQGLVPLAVGGVFALVGAPRP